MFFKAKDIDTAVEAAQAVAAIADAADAPDVGRGIESVVEAIAPMSTADGKKKNDNTNIDYEWQFATPFGKVEFDLDPKDLHEEKERRRTEKAERAAAKKAERIAKLAAKEAEKRGIHGPVVIVKRSNLVPALVIFTIVVAAVGIAIWLFARPGEEDELDAVPPELRNANALAGEAEQPSSGIFGRIKRAVREGKQASRDAQNEQQQRYEELSKQG